MRRVFFALPPTPALQDALARVATGVAAAAHGRATRTDSIHLTLAFIGDVASTRMPALVAIGGALAVDPFLLSLDRVGGFRRARVAWIAATAVPAALSTLQHGLSEALAANDFRTESRPFVPHLTLARHCANAISERAHHPALEWAVDAFALWATASRPGGAHYDELMRWALPPHGTR